MPAILNSDFQAAGKAIAVGCGESSAGISLALIFRKKSGLPCQQYRLLLWCPVIGASGELTGLGEETFLNGMMGQLSLAGVC
jgi:hypothetical protein